MPLNKELTQEEEKTYVHFLTSKNEESKKYITDTTQRYFLITPTWIRLLDIAGDPRDMYELDF